MSKSRRLHAFRVGIAVLGGLAACPVVSVVAQQVIQLQGRAGVAAVPAPPQPGDAGFTNAISLPTDRTAQQVMEAATQLIQEKEWGQAVKALQKLLDMPQDGFVKSTRSEDGQPKTRWVSIKEEANSLIGRMPKEGLQFYELQYGAEAKTRLDEAKKTGDAQLLAQVAQRYRHTASGAEATMLLATRCLSRDEPLMAALYFEQFRNRSDLDTLPAWTLYKMSLAYHRSGDKDGGDKLWERLVRKLGRDGQLTLGKQIYSLGDLRAELDRVGKEDTRNLYDWPTFRGGLTRTEQGFGGPPFLEHTWTTSTMPVKADVKSWTEDNINQAVSFMTQRQQPVLPAFFPIAAGGKLIYRSYDGVYALSLKKEGSLAWLSHTDGGVQTLLTDAQKKQQLDQWNNLYRANGPQGVLFENSVTGTLSTDGNRVFVVDDLVLPPHPHYLRNFQWGGQPNFGALSAMVNGNNLKAYNLETGKLMWQMGGRLDAQDSEWQGSFFLGPPLSLGGKIYLLNEKNSELRLVCLECKDTMDAARPPEVVWTQALATARDKLQFDFNRRTHAAQLSFADGILICPTNAGAVLGVDLLSHSLVWAHSYREGPPQEAAGNPAMGMGKGGVAWVNGMQVISAAASEWRASAPAVQDGRVIFTAPDANAMHCLSLKDGGLVWKVNRSADDLYFAGVFNGKALIVGKTYCRAIHVGGTNAGQQAWRIDGVGTPSGQGTASDNVYYLPLKSGMDKEPEVAAIDIEHGKIIAHTKSRKKEEPGNLIFYEGQVISQTLKNITAYPQLKVKLALIDERIKENPNDPVGRIERGELRLDKGDLMSAYDDLHIAMANNPPAELMPKAKLKLYETLTEMFQRDFEKNERFLEEYKALCMSDNQAEQQVRLGNYLCLLAKGREKQGRLVDAFTAYMDFGALSGNKELVSVIDEPSTKSPPAVWARGRITEMMKKATAEQRRPLEEKVAQQWQAIQESGDNVEALRGFVDVFGSGFAVGRQARLKLAERLIETAKDPKADELRDAQLHLLQLQAVKGTDPQIAAQAVATLAKLMERKGLMDHAAHYYKELGRDFAEVVVREGKTGRELYNDLATDKRYLPYLESQRQAWNGKFKATKIYGNFPMQPMFTLEPVGDLLPFFERHRVSLDMNMAILRVVDSMTGQETWQSSNLPSLQYLNHGQPNVRCTYSVQGHVVVVNLGHMVYGFDPVDKKKLWEYNLYAPGTNTNPQLGQVMRDRDGNLQLLYQDGWSQKLGQAGSAEASYVCLQTRNGLVALDPGKGTTLWTKSDVTAAKAQMFGDDQYVYLVETNTDGSLASATKAIRALDGVTVTVPDFLKAYQNKVRVLGRNILVREEQDKSVVMRLYDLQTGKDAWVKKFPAGSVVMKNEDTNQTGVVDPEGNVTVFDIFTQKELLKTTVKKDEIEKLQDAFILADRDQFYLILNKTNDPNLNNGIWMNVYHGMRCLTVNGTMYAFDRATGERKWANPVTNQMLVLEQFRDLPVLLFTARYNKWIVNGANRFAQHVIAAKTIHKVNGKLLFDEELTNNANNFHALQVDPKGGTIDLVSFNLKIRHQLEANDGAKPAGGEEKKPAVEGEKKAGADNPAVPVPVAVPGIRIRIAPAVPVPQPLPAQPEKK